MAKHLPKEERILVIIGPSGSGKSSVIHQLSDRGLIEVTPSWTTRPPRQDEVDNSIEHIFIDSETFEQKKRERFFLKTVTPFGLPFKYGLPQIAKPLGNRVPTIMLRAPLVPMVPLFYPSYLTYQLEDDLERIRPRLAKRSAEGEQLGSRLADYEWELTSGREVADRVFINSSVLSDTVAAVERALQEDFKLA